jgi:cobalt/nickel transport protein
MLKKNLLLLLAVAALAILPLVIHHGGPAEFGGADNEAAKLVETMRPGYQPWFTPIWEPPSGEVASLLFSLQAALGAGLIGFYFGRRTAPGRRKDRQPAGDQA